MEPVLLSLDIGTSGARASAFTQFGRLVTDVRVGYETDHPRPGWAEQSADDWRHAAHQALASLSRQLDNGYHLAGMAVTGHSPTYLPVDAGLQPLGPALTYQDNRAVAEAEELTQRYGEDAFHARYGHSPEAHFVLPKVMWHQRHDPALFERLHRVLQPTDFIVLWLTGELATSTSHACGTLAFDQTTGRWDEALLAAAGLKPGLFPLRVLNPWEVAGNLRGDVADSTGLPAGMPVVIGAPDSQACCLGVGATMPQILSNMSGSSTCLNSTVTAMVADVRVGNYMHAVPGRWTTEVGLNTTGESLTWLGNILLSHTPPQQRYEIVDEMAAKSPIGANGVVFLPYLSDGERDNHLIKGGFHNLSIGTDGADLVRAVMEGVAYAERKRIQILMDAGCPLQQMYISGGGARLDQWNQLKADVTGMPVRATVGVDAAELGTAMLAGIGAGLYDGTDDAVECCRTKVKEFTPDHSRALQYEEGFRSFVALERALETTESYPD